MLVGDAPPFGGAHEGVDEGAGVGRASLLLGGDQPPDVEQGRRQHGAGDVDEDFAGERGDAGARGLREGDGLIERRNRRRFGVAGELEQDVLESHWMIPRPDRLYSGKRRLCR